MADPGGFYGGYLTMSQGMGENIDRMARLKSFLQQREAALPMEQEIARNAPALVSSRLEGTPFENRKMGQELALRGLVEKRAYMTLAEQMRRNAETERNNRANEGIRRDALNRTRQSASEMDKLNLKLAPKGYQVSKDADGNLTVNEPAGLSALREKDLSGRELEDLRENMQGLEAAKRAYALMSGRTYEGVKGDKNATGLKGYVPNIFLQRLDPEGVATRGPVGNIGSLKIKQRSGGAVPAAEMDRLNPFVPRETDAPDVARSKLEGFIREYTKMLQEDVGAFTESGRKIPVGLRKMIDDRIGAARGDLPGGGGNDEAKAVLQAIQAELANRQRSRPSAQ